MQPSAGQLEQHYAGRVAEIAELVTNHFDLRDDAERAVDYSIWVAERAQRRWADAVCRRPRPNLPDTLPNTLRRIDVITNQTELLFAIRRHRDHIAVLESICSLVDHLP